MKLLNGKTRQKTYTIHVVYSKSFSSHFSPMLCFVDVLHVQTSLIPERKELCTCIKK